MHQEGPCVTAERGSSGDIPPGTTALTGSSALTDSTAGTDSGSLPVRQSQQIFDLLQLFSLEPVNSQDFFLWKSISDKSGRICAGIGTAASGAGACFPGLDSDEMPGA